jgi:hypothetical protein
MSKFAYRFLLSDLWEFGKNESWFSYMAAKGMHLQNVGNWLVTFEKGEPKNTRYRIEILEENPTLEQLNVYKECGWQLVMNKQIFYIFSSPEELNSTELHTDPMEQSFTFKMLDKQIKKSTTVIVIAVILALALLLAHLFLDSEPYLNLIRRSSFTTITMTIAYIYILCTAIQGYFSVKKIKNSLFMGIPINHSRNWKLSYFLSALVYVTLILWIFSAIISPIYSVIKRESYTSPKAVENLPAIRINEIESGKIYDYWHDLQYNWSLLSPVQYRIYEGGYVEGEMQEDFSGAYSPASVITRYYELAFKGMAEGLLKDLIHHYHRDYRDIEPVKIESNKFDLLYIFDYENIKSIYASFDNKVIYVKYYGNEDLDKIISLIEKRYGL